MFGKFFTDHAASRGAREDAGLGLDSVEERVVRRLGPRPDVDPAGNAEHARLVASMDRTRIEEIREDVVSAEDAGEKRSSPWLFRLGLAVALACELFGALRLTRAIGLDANERLPIGVMIAFAVIGLTALTARRAIGAEAGPSAPPAPPSWRSALPGTARSLILYAVYALVIIAITVIRLRSADDDDASLVWILADAVIMLAATLGPAWSVELLLRKHAPAAEHAKRLGQLRRRLRMAERDEASARRAVERIHRDRSAWDERAARMRAAFRVEHRVATAKSSDSDSPAVPAHVALAGIPEEEK